MLFADYKASEFHRILTIEALYISEMAAQTGLKPEAEVWVLSMYLARYLVMSREEEALFIPDTEELESIQNQAYTKYEAVFGRANMPPNLHVFFEHTPKIRQKYPGRL